MQCPKCNQTVANDARFCSHCGQLLSVAGDPAASGSAPLPGAAPPRGPIPPAVAIPPGGPAAGAAASGNLIDRIKAILLTPNTEWPIIEAEPTSVSQLYQGYVIPLAAFAGVMSFIRFSLIGVGLWHLPVVTGALYALLRFGSAPLGVYLIGLIIDGLAPTFAGQRNQRQAFKTVAYSFTPAAVGTLLGLFPVLGPVLQLLGALYSIYLLYLGLPVLMRSPPDKSVAYTATGVICTLLVVVLLGVVMSVFGRMTGYSPYAGPYGYE